MDPEIITVAGRLYRRAGWPQRVAAKVIDLLLVFVWLGVAGAHASATGSVVEGVVVPLVALGYFLAGNGLLHGASVGKRLIGLKVIDGTHGASCGVALDLLRHRYLLMANPLFLVLTAYDASQGCFEKADHYVVQVEPVSAAEVKAKVDEALAQQRPAKLDLAGLKGTLQHMREARGDAHES